MIKELIIFGLIAYLLGSIPSGVWLGRYVFKKDIRSVGSGNTGTTNAFRAFGPWGGLLVFFCDFLKGAVAVWIPMYFETDIHPIVFGLIACIGHAYPIFEKFKGGKAVATAAGVAFAVAPLFLLSALGVFFLVLYFSRMVSLSSLLAVTYAVIMIIIFHEDWLVKLIALFALIFIVYRHRDNIKRIANGTEAKVPFGFRAHKDSDS